MRCLVGSELKALCGLGLPVFDLSPNAIRNYVSDHIFTEDDWRRRRQLLQRNCGLGKAAESERSSERRDPVGSSRRCLRFKRECNLSCKKARVACSALHTLAALHCGLGWLLCAPSRPPARMSSLFG